MKRYTQGPAFTLFIVMMGVTVREAYLEKDWTFALSWMAVGLLILCLDAFTHRRRHAK